MTRLPNIPKELLDKLEECFPAQDYGPTVSVDKIRYHSGQRSVITFLRHHYERQQSKNILDERIGEIHV